MQGQAGVRVGYLGSEARSSGPLPRAGFPVNLGSTFANFASWVFSRGRKLDSHLLTLQHTYIYNCTPHAVQFGQGYGLLVRNPNTLRGPERSRENERIARAIF